MVLDTGELNVNQLRARVTELFGDRADHRMQTSVVSFGYKHGVPLDADVVFDCRFLPNPHWRDDLRPLSGLDGPCASMSSPSRRPQSSSTDSTLCGTWCSRATKQKGSRT